MNKGTRRVEAENLIRLPKLSLGMEEGRIINWLATPGERILKDEPIAEIETDKAVVELPMPRDGVVGRFLVEAGERVPVGDAIAELQGEKTAKNIGFIAISPAARRKAGELKVDYSSITGSGPNGRIVYRDIEESAPARSLPNRPEPLPVGTEVESRRGPLSGMRRTIARRMHESVQTIPQFSVTFCADVSNLLRTKDFLQASLAKREIKLSLTDFMIRAIAETLQAHRTLNASFVGHPMEDAAHIVEHRHVNVGLAVAVEGGLMVPVIPEAERLPVMEIASLRVNRVAEVRAGVSPSEHLQGGTVTLSNLGAYGVSQFQAIVNPPESLILAIGAVRDEAVVREGKMEIRPIMRITGSFDHRVIDGGPASEFMRDLVRAVESKEWFLI